MFNVLTKLLDSNDREVKKLSPVITEVSALEGETRKLKDRDFPKKTAELKERIQNGASIFLVLPEAFALVREAAQRTTGLRPYDVQLIASTVLAQGKIAEQKTGEGKTLSAVPALYLHALTGRGVHLVTVNDYLARRDAGWMGSIFHFLGMSVSSIINDNSFIYDPDYTDQEAKDYRLLHLRSINRAEAYSADVTYGINSEFGFDYLRDNMARPGEILRQRGYYYAIIDEADSVLIDEARTPHIISMPDATPSQKYYEYSKVVEKLSPDTDYKVDEKQRTAHLTDHGILKIEKLFNIRDIYEKDFDTVYHIEAALKARTLFHNNKDYIVRDNQIILVDEFTGRLLEGRRLSEGIHQAIEAKEGVTIQQESKTLATVSLQNYFRMYELLAGMTGTATTEAEEFHKIYKLDVVSIPTHKPMSRIDQSDVIYKTTRAKVSAVVKEVEESYRKGQPVLVGTTSIEKNEIISEFLKRKKIPHEILNAKNHVREALIIKDAGKRGAVTVATNMAGRGVDIILGGQPPSKFELEYQDEKGEKRYVQEQAEWQQEHDAVVKAGGLLVIGTEKHESRRIDNQLRGRSGRQGDPGRSVFIISLEDDLMRIFGGEQIANMMTRFNFPEDQPLSHGLVSRVIEQAQVKVEGFNFEIRKNTVEYDDVLNKQREIIYTTRKNIFEGKKDIGELVTEKVREEIGRIVSFNLDTVMDGNGFKNIIEGFVNIVPFDDHSKTHLAQQVENLQTHVAIVEFLERIAKEIHEKRETQFGPEAHKQVLTFLALQTIDNLWMDHLTAIEDLRTGIHLSSYAQKDPLVEYKNQAFGMFERLMTSIDDGITHTAYKFNLVDPNVMQQETAKTIVLNQPEAEVGEAAGKKQKQARSQPLSNSTNDSSHHKLGRNAPCWCGSGKKYKKCHYPQLA